MKHEAIMLPAYVIKAEDLGALNHLDRNHPRPRRLEWINRGTNQLLRPTSIEMLLRTLFREVKSPSVVKLHQSAGLRAVFGTDQERDKFATAFASARSQESEKKEYLVSAIFEDREGAERAVTTLKDAGVREKSLSIMWRASKFLDGDYRWSEGHSTLSVAGAVAGGGIAGAMLGIAVLFVPGVGPIATAGVLAASAFSSVATLSGIIGATGGAIARMLTDHDVDGVAARYYEEEIRRGKVFVSVDTRSAGTTHADILQILKRCGGRSAIRN
jgi:hypothetical protein